MLLRASSAILRETSIVERSRSGHGLMITMPRALFTSPVRECEPPWPGTRNNLAMDVALLHLLPEDFLELARVRVYVVEPRALGSLDADEPAAAVGGRRKLGRQPSKCPDSRHDDHDEHGEHGPRMRD